jgi:hypothetical protein
VFEKTSLRNSFWLISSLPSLPSLGLMHQNDLLLIEAAFEKKTLKKN